MMSDFNYKEHLHILRTYCIQFLMVWFSLFITCYWFHKELLERLLTPINLVSPIVINQVLAPLTLPIQISIDLSLLCALPFGMIQIWRFIKPALYPHEKKTIQFLLLIAASLFIAGGVFCWQVICPFIFSLVTKQNLAGLLWMPTFQSIYSFITSILLFFGVSFQLPLILLILNMANIISLEKIIQLRPYAIVLAFTIGMLVTPPDVLSQVVVAIPLCVLYETSILLIRMIKKRRQIASVLSLKKSHRGKL